jgi:hypothetical protein
MKVNGFSTFLGRFRLPVLGVLLIAIATSVCLFVPEPEHDALARTGSITSRYAGNYITGKKFAFEAGISDPDGNFDYAAPTVSPVSFADSSSLLGAYKILTSDGETCNLYCMAMTGYPFSNGNDIAEWTAADFNYYASSRNRIYSAYSSPTHNNCWNGACSWNLGNGDTPNDDYADNPAMYDDIAQFRYRIVNRGAPYHGDGAILPDDAWRLAFIMDAYGNNDTYAACIKKMIFTYIGPMPVEQEQIWHAQRQRTPNSWDELGNVTGYHYYFDPPVLTQDWIDMPNGLFVRMHNASVTCPPEHNSVSALWNWAGDKYIYNGCMQILTGTLGQKMYVSCGGPRMSVGLTSLVPPAQRYVTGTMTDTINLTSSASGLCPGGSWLSYGPGNTPIPVVITSKLWGPYQTPLPTTTTLTGTPAGSKTYTYTSAGTYTTTFSPAEATAAATDGNMFKPGYYYWTYEMNAGDQTTGSPIDGYIQSKYITNYGVKIGAVEANEWTVQQFQPKSTSNANTLLVTNDAASHAVDVVRVYAARGSAGNANQTTGSPTNGGDPGAVNVGGNEQTWWLKDINGYIPVTYCVDIYGPFTTRQDLTQTPSGAQLAVRPTAEMGLDGDYTKCFTTTRTEGPNQYYTVDFGHLTEPGFYHYRTTMVRAEQTNTTLGDSTYVFAADNLNRTAPQGNNVVAIYSGLPSSTVARDYIITDWTSPFSEVNETSVTQFQVKAVSDAMVDGRGGATPDSEGDVVEIVRPDQTEQIRFLKEQLDDILQDISERDAFSAYRGAVLRRKVVSFGISH